MYINILTHGASLVAQMQGRRPGFDPWVGKVLGRRKCQRTPVFWEIPWIEEPGKLQPMGSQRVRHDLMTKQQQHTNMYP